MKQQTPATASPLLSRIEAAQYLGLSEKTLATWATVQRYPLPVTKIGRRALYHIDDLNQFIAAGRGK